jgi:hypothetical protein
VRLDPHHLGARHHHLAGDRVAEREDRVDHLALAVLHHAPLLGQVDQLAQLDLGGERPLPEAPAGRDHVADQDQQRGERAERPAQPAHQRGGRAAHRVRVLAADRARADAHHDEADHGHRAGRDQRGRPPGGERVDGHQRDERGGGQLAEQSQQQEQVEVADHVGGDDLQGAGAAHSLAGQLGGARRRDGGQGGVGHRHDAGQHDEPGREYQQLKVG